MTNEPSAEYFSRMRLRYCQKYESNGNLHWRAEPPTVVGCSRPVSLVAAVGRTKIADGPLLVLCAVPQCCIESEHRIADRSTCLSRVIPRERDRSFVTVQNTATNGGRSEDSRIGSRVLSLECDSGLGTNNGNRRQAFDGRRCQAHSSGCAVHQGRCDQRHNAVQQHRSGCFLAGLQAVCRRTTCNRRKAIRCDQGLCKIVRY